MVMPHALVRGEELADEVVPAQHVALVDARVAGLASVGLEQHQLRDLRAGRECKSPAHASDAAGKRANGQAERIPVGATPVPRA